MARRALLMLAASAMLFGAMAFCAKLASTRLSGSQVALLRFAIGSLPFLLIPTFRRASFTFQRADLLFYRGFFGGLAVLFYFLAIEHVPVGIATLLNYTAPIFSGIFAAVFIGEPIRPRVAIPLVIAFTGVYLVVRSHIPAGHHLLGIGIWEVVGLLSAICSGAAVTAIRTARRTEGSWSIYASFTIFGFLVAAPFAFTSWKSPTPWEWGAVAAVGLFSLAAQLLMTHAFRWVETLIAGVISQLAVVVSMALGALWLHERLTIDRIIGSALTIGGLIAVMAVSAAPRSGFEEAPEQ